MIWNKRSFRTKKFFAITITAWVSSSATFAAPLSEDQSKFILAYLSTKLVEQECQVDYSLKKGGLQKFQDGLGVDDRTLLAAVAAAQLISDQQYNRSDLIPEVTQFVKPALTLLLQELDSDKRRFCKRFGDAFVKQGILQKVHE